MQRVDQWITGVPLERHDRDFGRCNGRSAMAQTVYDGKPHAVRNGTSPMPVTRLRFSGHRCGGCAPFDIRRFHLSHFLTVTVVPCPSSDPMVNSSINRLTPGSPRPKPPEVE